MRNSKECPPYVSPDNSGPGRHVLPFSELRCTFSSFETYDDFPFPSAARSQIFAPLRAGVVEGVRMLL